MRKFQTKTESINPMVQALALRSSGKTWAEVGKKFDLSKSSIKEICNRLYNKDDYLSLDTTPLSALNGFKVQADMGASHKSI